MNKVKILSIVLLAILSLSSCTGVRKALKAPLKEQGAAYLVEQLAKNKVTFDQLSAKFTANYQAAKNEMSVSGSLRLQYDSIIWISVTPAFGLEAARFMLTQDSIKFINRLKNEYFANDFSFINQLLNKTLDFDMAQSFLMGNDFSLYETDNFKTTIDNQQYKLSTLNRHRIKRSARVGNNEAMVIPLQDIWLDGKTFKITKVLITEPGGENRKFSAEYGNFQDIEGQLFPMSVVFLIETGEKKVRMAIDYSKVQFNKEQAYPFTIPAKYTRIENF